MSSRAISDYEWTCDVCEATALTRGERPEGWTRQRVYHHNCGLTNYTRTEHYDACAECSRTGRRLPHQEDT